MTKATDLAARAARISNRPSTAQTVGADQVSDENAGDTPPPRRQPRAAPRAKPVRVTTDLAPQSYRALLVYCSDMAEDLGLAKVPHVEVIRALVSELTANAELQATIRKAVTARLSK